MDPTIWVTIGGIASLVITTIVAPILLRKADWARQDQVAADAKAASKELIDGQKQAAQLLLKNNEQVTALGEETQKQIKVIHTLVNSEKTEAKREALDTHVTQLAFMREIVDLKRVAGHEPTVEALAAIEAICLKIDIMKKDLEQREQQNALAARIMAASPVKVSKLDSMFDETVHAVSKKEP